MTILQLSTADAGGGAEHIARALHRGYRARGRDCWLAVGRKSTGEDRVVEIGGADPTVMEANGNSASMVDIARETIRNHPSLATVARFCVRPRHTIETWLGVEDFHYPASRQVVNLLPTVPQIIHGHNLHGGYFDLRVLPSLCRTAPTVLTLHDAWLMSGHCAHSLQCERWRTGCGQCPDLSLDPAIPRDATAYNWRRKRNILKQCRLHIVTPSEWLMRKVRESILAPAVLEQHVIPNGIDLTMFRPGNRLAARRKVGIDENTWMLLFVANHARRSAWKDYETMRRAVALVAEHDPDRSIVFIGLGGSGTMERIGLSELRMIPYESDRSALAAYYQAADLYLHAARADTFPTTVLEALACGTPVVATATGGIPEQVKGLTLSPHTTGEGHTCEQATGAIVPQGDAAAMGAVIQSLLADDPLRQKLADNASADALARFDVERQVDKYLGLYERMWHSADSSVSLN